MQGLTTMARKLLYTGQWLINPTELTKIGSFSTYTKPWPKDTFAKGDI